MILRGRFLLWAITFRHIHVSENHRGILGSGHVGFSVILRELRNIAFRGILTIEGFGTPEREDDLLPVWRDPRITSDQFAERSTRYLQTLLDMQETSGSPSAADSSALRLGQ